MAYQALYRKYRPTNFDEVVGQTHIIQTLKNAIVQNRIAHAYLFCGPRGTGKTSIAKIFAKTLNCTNSQDAPCGVCENCKMAANGSHPDIIEIDARNEYKEADVHSDELIRGFVKNQEKNSKSWRKYQLFDMCQYTENGSIRFEISKQMTDFLLNLTGSFSQPLLHDFLKMRSPYSMAIWHLMQMKMKSKKPGITATMGFDISLAELRKVTGCTDKLKQVGEFKKRVLDKALREIFDCAGVKITYQNIKVGRTVEGFRFFAEGIAHIDLNRIPLAEQERIQANAERLKKGEPLQ